MADDKDKTLLAEVKNYLDITWEDALGEQKLMGIVQRGMAAIKVISMGKLRKKRSSLIMLCMPGQVKYQCFGIIIGRK